MKLSILSQYLTRTFLASLLALISSNSSLAQDCTSTLTLVLENIDGGVYTNQKVMFKSQADGKEYNQTSNVKGEVVFELPCDQMFTVKIDNYTRDMEMPSTKYNGSSARSFVSYAPDMAEKDKVFALDASQKKALDLAISRIPDTTDFTGSIMPKPRDIENYSIFVFTVTDLKKGPLEGELVTMSGTVRNKSFRGNTNKSGTVVFYLPKGDKYSVNFVYNKDYSKHEVRYTRGTAEASMNLMYLGTPEMRRRHLAELERIRLEEERLKQLHDEHVAWCKKRGVSEEEGHVLKIKEAAERAKLRESLASRPDTVVSAVLNRHVWSQKLIVCDLTGSMNPYAGQLSAWYQLNYKLEKNLQFVFFNDGDGKSSGEKVIGETGGIYYEKATSLGALTALMGKVKGAGHGGDCPENNMEALIKGVKMANPYKELVMIVDNNAPVKDIELLKDFNKPVHIILCGATRGFILADYLLIAWKTKGSIHTIEEDITKIATMSEGQTITVQGFDYKIMGGQFVKLTGI